jgi:GT2 family glycosyltransferase
MRWQSPETLPEKDEDDRFMVYLAFDDGSVKLADWVSYTLTGAEYHSTGAYLGEYAYDGDSLYMTEDGFDVRKTDDGGWETFMCDDDDEGSEKRLLVVGWMEALVPAPQWADL